jgi:hypothetical protein
VVAQLRSEQGDLVTGTWAGVDQRLVYHEPMPVGQYAVSLWYGDAHRFLLSDAIVTGLAARVLRHLDQEHGGVQTFDSLEANVCSIETCATARRWNAEAVELVEAVNL